LDRDAEGLQLRGMLPSGGGSRGIQRDAQPAQRLTGLLLTEQQCEQKVFEVRFAATLPGCLFHGGGTQGLHGRGGGQKAAHEFLLGTGMVGSMRLAYFLCTACLLTPSASAISCQLRPDRSAASTCLSSRTSARTRNDDTARRPARGSLRSAAMSAIVVDSMVSTYVAWVRVVNSGCYI